jgi:hypothetical protein
MKLKCFCVTKEMVSKLKRLLTEWDKGLITRIYRELIKLNFPKINNPMKKWANHLNRAFSMEEVQMAKKKNEEMPSIPGHKGNANQNQIKIPLHSC